MGNTYNPNEDSFKFRILLPGAASFEEVIPGAGNMHTAKTIVENRYPEAKSIVFTGVVHNYRD